MAHGAATSSALLDAVGADVDPASFLAGDSTPVFVGSALTNFGVRMLLDAVVDLAPPPSPASTSTDEPRPLDAGFSAFVFKVQANMDPSHRDRLAFARICSGRFERGMTVDVRPHRARADHEVRHHRVRRRPRDRRGGVPRRRRRPRQRHRAAARRHDLRRRPRRLAGDVPADPPLLARGLRHRPAPRHRPRQAVPPRPRAARRGRRRAGAARPRHRRHEPGPRRRRRSCSSRCSATAWPASSTPRPRSSPPATRRSGAPIRRRSPACARSAASASCTAPTAPLVALFENRYRLARLEADEPELTLEPLVAGAIPLAETFGQATSATPRRWRRCRCPSPPPTARCAHAWRAAAAGR